MTYSVNSFAYYNETTGVLEQYDILVDFKVIATIEIIDPELGTYIMAWEESSITESKVTRVAPPDEPTTPPPTTTPPDETPSPLAEFFAENKWYFVLGGVALVALAIAIPTTAYITRRKATTGKTKEKSKRQ